MGVPRKVYFPENIGELRSLLRENFPVIGGGSNAVLSDRKTPLISTNFLKSVELKRNQITLGAGIKLSQILKLQQKRGFSLFEFLAGIPRATVGGLVAQNAGAFGREIKELLISITYIDRETGEITVMETEEIEKKFRYRETPFPEKGIILQATFKIEPCNNPGKTVEKFVKLRLSKQPPFYLKTAGSTFKNPTGYSAGKLLDLVGLKGFSSGNLEFSKIHANFIINRGNATYPEFLQLMETAKEKVRHQFNILLEPEIKIF